ncbi:MAG: GGDEF domain-containing protein [Planctomycetaceae bacterium]|nr:GGDEF domain-containing protein [Planctomycetales bacterium]MCB9921332.1 GGDEF domain-containing protein [Planctomycetaceae bacterium]
MYLPAITETPSFLFGVLLGALLLCMGLCLGVWFGRRATMLYDVRSMDRDQVQHLLSGLFQWTHGFANDVSQYREFMDGISTKLSPGDNSTDDGQVSTLMAQIVQANEQLQQRLNHAEAALKDQAEEITAYMSEARTDTLTDLPNRRAFDDELTRRMAEWRRNETYVNVVILDIDHFKRFNDQFGHAAGDAVLVEVARVMNAATRESDMVARLGGEEFAVVLAGVEASEARRAAERIRKAVAANAFRYEGKSLRVTVSCGVALALAGEDGVSLMKRADDALYASKAAGRNVSHWHDSQRCVLLTASSPESRQSALTPQPPPSDAAFVRVCDDLRQRLLEVACEDA